MQKNIQLLEESVINQIKAGEVIDSPAGIVKELIENSIDAGANEITLELINNGIDQINIKDNGFGIHFKDLPLAFSRHATSKLETFKDLYHLNTLGFRGEALASLSSVADVKCITSTTVETTQFQIKAESILIHEKSKKTPSKTGTQLIIKDLFFNTPVRHKFLHSKSKQKNDIVKIFNGFLLTYPNISFHLKFDDKDKTSFKATTLQKRIEKVLKLSSEDLKTKASQYEDVTTEIFISRLAKSRPKQFILVNGRIVLDEKIKNTMMFTLLNAGHDKNVDWLVFLNVPSHKIDVNIHPKKTSILFFQQSVITSLVSNTLKQILEKTEYRQPAMDPIKSSISQSPIHNSDHTQNTFQFNDQSSNPKSHLEVFAKQEFYKVIYSWSDNDLFLIEKERKVFILTKKSLQKFIQARLEKNSFELIPLLVSEPISVTIEEDLGKKWGFETQHLNNDTIIKALPDLLSYFNFQSILTGLVSDTFENAFLNTFISNNELQYFLNQTDISELTLHPISSEQLQQHFC